MARAPAETENWSENLLTATKTWQTPTRDNNLTRQSRARLHDKTTTDASHKNRSQQYSDNLEHRNSLLVISRGMSDHRTAIKVRTDHLERRAGRLSGSHNQRTGMIRIQPPESMVRSKIAAPTKPRKGATHRRCSPASTASSVIFTSSYPKLTEATYLNQT